jgi:hypothetical protein
MPYDGVRLKKRRWAAHFDQEDNGRNDRDRSGRVHRNTQRAMVRIAFDLMDVRHLDHGQ